MLIINTANNNVVSTCSDSAKLIGTDIVDGNNVVMGGIEAGLDLQFLYKVLYDGTVFNYGQYITYPGDGGTAVLDKSSIPLADYKKIKITELKQNCNVSILDTYPLWKQNNYMNYDKYSDITVTDYDNMCTFIATQRAACDTQETSINSASDIAGVDAVDITF